MRNHSSNNHFVIIICLFMVSAIITGCATLSGSLQVNPGRVYGQIKFQNTSTEVASYLSANVVVPAPIYFAGDEAVRLYELGSNEFAAAEGYSPVNTAPDALTYIAGSFDISPNVENTGSDFLAVVDSIELADGATYMMGSYNQTSSAAQICTGVMPVSSHPAGTQCDINECAGLVNVHFRFAGDSADLNALDATVPASCSIDIEIEDPAGSGALTQQAQSGSRNYSIGSLTGSGATVPILIRETPSPLKVTIKCSAKVQSGEDGFVIIPSTGMTPFRTDYMVNALACGQSITTPPIDIIVERNAGKLQGYFDVSEHDEAGARISIDSSYSSFYLTPSNVSAGSTPTNKWIFEGIPAGIHSVITSALVDGGDKQLQFPHKDGATNQPVTIYESDTTDIGATFVSKTVEAEGSVRLFDMAGSTDLDAITTAPFTSSYTVSSYQTSYMEALGDSDIPINLPNAGSGIGATSRARLLGSYDPTGHEALMSYQLLLNGLSPENGSLDGSDTKPTLWDIDYLDVTFKPTDTMMSESKIALGYDFHYLADANVNSAIQIPEQQICFGKIELAYQIDPALGALYFPRMDFSDTGPFTSNIDGGTQYTSVGGKARGMPNSFEERAATAHLSATVPQGFQYKVYNKIYLAPADASSSTEASYTYLGYLNIPHEGVVKCGSVAAGCANLTNVDGDYTLLSVSILDSSGVDTPEYCLANGTLDLTVNVTSDLDVIRLAYVIDPVLDPSLETREAVEQVCNNSPTAVLCTGCGVSPTHDMNIASLPPGDHVVYACATDTAIFCYDEYRFSVTDEDLALQCAPDFTVTLNPGETEISATDPRITNNLSATINGNCGVPVSIIPPAGPDTFACGMTTDLQFSASGIGSCTTRVTVNCPQEHIIAFISKQTTGLSMLEAYGVESGALKFSYILSGTGQGFSYDFDKKGEKIGIIHLNHIYQLDANTGAMLQQTFVAAPVSIHSRIAFDPVDNNRYAISGAASTGAYSIFLYNGTTALGSVNLQFDPMTGVPAMAWSNDASHLVAGTATPIMTAGDYNYRVSAYQWNVTPSGFDPGVDQVHTNKNYSPREEIHEILKLPSDVLISTTRGISKIIGSNVHWLNKINNNDMDVVDKGNLGVFVRDSGSELRWGIAKNLNTGSPIIGWGPEISSSLMTKPQVAISDDGKYCAITLANTVKIYNVSGLTFVRDIPAVDPVNVQFKPLPF